MKKALMFLLFSMVLASCEPRYSWEVTVTVTELRRNTSYDIISEKSTSYTKEYEECTESEIQAICETFGSYKMYKESYGFIQVTTNAKYRKL